MSATSSASNNEIPHSSDFQLELGLDLLYQSSKPVRLEQPAEAEQQLQSSYRPVDRMSPAYNDLGGMHYPDQPTVELARRLNHVGLGSRAVKRVLDGDADKKYYNTEFNQTGAEPVPPDTRQLFTEQLDALPSRPMPSWDADHETPGRLAALEQARQNRRNPQ